MKAHAGSTGNELADHLAKQAAKSNSKPLYRKIPKSALLANPKTGNLGKMAGIMAKHRKRFGNKTIFAFDHRETKNSDKSHDNVNCTWKT